ncbi:MAG: hypothetical protein D6767_04030 [Candidatus Hydrogenedentota bacterium]|nr:MAG: hypothetical protein D6767_04030 [Candidatus Hydrogenedentota bacterium]
MEKWQNKFRENLAWIFASGFVFLYFAQTLFEASSFWRIVLYVLCAVAFLAPFLYFLFSLRKTISIEVKKTLLWIFIIGFLAIVFYFIQSDLFLAKIAYDPAHKENQDLYKKLLILSRVILYLCIAVLAFFTVLVESGLKVQAQAEARSRYIRITAFQTVLFLAVIVAAMFAANKRPFTIDMTDFHKFSLSPEGKAIVKKIKRKVEITAFYPFFDTLQRSVEPMLADIQSTNPKIHYRIVDPYRDKDIADKKKINSKGVVLFESIDPQELDIQKRERRKLVFITSKSDLKKMEKEFISALLSVTEPRKKICITTGHGEYGVAAFSGEEVSNAFESALISSNYEIERLDPRKGFPKEVPSDCSAVMIPMLTKPLTYQEVKTLQNYYQKGGSLLLFFDPISRANPQVFLKPYHLLYKKGTLLSEASAKGQPEVIIAFDYTSSPITADYTKLPEPARFSVFPTTGYFEKENPLTKKKKEKKDEPEMDFFVRTVYRTWEDIIPNKIQDIKKEPSKAYWLAVSIKDKKSRLVAFADSDFITDKYITAGINLPIAVGAVQWLTEGDTIRGIVPKKWEEAHINLTPKQDDFLFYFLVFFWPLFISGIGYWFFVRKRKKQEIVKAT